MGRFQKLAFEAKDILEFIKENPEIVGAPVGAGAGVGLMRALTDKKDRGIADYALSGLGGAGAGALASKALSPGKMPPPPPESMLSSADRGMRNALGGAWDNKGILSAVAALALAARFRAQIIPPLRAIARPLADSIMGPNVPPYVP